jgi:hypothetical protein
VLLVGVIVALVPLLGEHAPRLDAGALARPT